MNCRKRHFITFLFLFYFSFYVISPLCYTENGISEDTAITHATKHSTKKIRIIWELILSKLSQKEDAADNGSEVQFFVKKARAVLSSNNIEKTAQSESEVLSFDNPFPPVESVAFHIEFADTDPQSGFFSSFSGLSPPYDLL
ncbi:MAG: hypothetical protein ACK415_03570 [Thermodesulfovibrionales bacterium]